MTTLSQPFTPAFMSVSINVPVVLCTIDPTVIDCPKQRLSVCEDVAQGLMVRFVVTTLSQPFMPALIKVSINVPVVLCTIVATVIDCPKQRLSVCEDVAHGLMVRLVVTTLSQPFMPALMSVSMKVPVVL